MRVALYLRVSTDSQTVENQLRDLTEVGKRLGWEVVRVFQDEGISGAKGRQQRPGFDQLLRGVVRREFDLIAAWSVCRLGRSLQDLVGFLQEIEGRSVGLYLHQQALDTSTPAGRAMFGMLSVFSDFERAMIRSRVVAGLNRARASGKRLGRPGLDDEVVQQARVALSQGQGIRATARALKISPAAVQRLKNELTHVAR